jgi:hypothetical protein
MSGTLVGAAFRRSAAHRPGFEQTKQREREFRYPQTTASIRRASRSISSA